MAESPKPSLNTRAAKFTTRSNQSSSHTVTSSDCQQHDFVKREWPTCEKSGPSRYHIKYCDEETKALSEQGDAQYLGPMERWEREDPRQSPWNNLESYVAFRHTADQASSQKAESEDDNWSMTGNAQSEK